MRISPSIVTLSAKERQVIATAGFVSGTCFESVLNILHFDGQFLNLVATISLGATVNQYECKPQKETASRGGTISWQAHVGTLDESSRGTIAEPVEAATPKQKKYQPEKGAAVSLHFAALRFNRSQSDIRIANLFSARDCGSAMLSVLV